jgi:hypothetical protein
MEYVTEAEEHHHTSKAESNLDFSGTEKMLQRKNHERNLYFYHDFPLWY